MENAFTNEKSRGLCEMLGKKKDKAGKHMIDTMIGANTVIRGAIIAEETLRIDGAVQGEAISKGAVIVGADGVIEGDVTAESILVAGRVKGNIYVREKTEITADGSVEGDITTKTLVIDEGAAFKGSCYMQVSDVVIENPEVPAVEEKKESDAAKEDKKAS